MSTHEYEIVVPPDVSEVIVRIRVQPPEHRRPATPIPLIAQVTMPDHVEDAWYPLLTGVHLRFRQDKVTPEDVVNALDLCKARGLEAGLVIAVHNAPGPYGGVFTRHTRRLPDGEVIPDYWSDAFFNEWLTIRKQIAQAVKGHPALKWVGMDYGLDDEAWPAKPWSRVPEEWRWDYVTRYVSAAWELAKMYAPLPVVAQVATFLRQGLEMLYWGYRSFKSPENLGIKHNGFHPSPDDVPGLEAKIRPFWDWCRSNNRMCILEPGMVPTGNPEEDKPTAEKLVERATAWGAHYLVLQPKFLSALASAAG